MFFRKLKRILRRNKILFIALAVVLLILIVYFSFSEDNIIANKIVIIPIKGTITLDNGGLFSESGSGSLQIVEQLRNADEDKSIKAIILDINSPGGTVVASKEIADAVGKIRKPVVSLIREVGASGAYWVASASDKIVADPLSMTGSIGVTGSYLEFSGLMDEYGITYQEFSRGDYKEVGSPYKDLSENERRMMQSKIDKIYLYFVGSVMVNRNITDKELARRISTGEVFLGLEAKEYNLIDDFGDRDVAVEIAKGLANISSAELVKFEDKVSFIDLVGRLSPSWFFQLGRGIGSEIKLDSSNNLEVFA